MSRGLWVIFFYCVYVALNDLVLLRLIPTNYDKYSFSAFTLIEYLSFTAYMWLINRNSIIRRLLVASFLLFTVFIITYFINVEFNMIDSIPIGVESILVILFSIYFLYQEINQATTVFLYNKPKFWIIAGFLIYLSGSFFIFLYANQVPKDELNSLWSIINVLNLLKNLFFCLAIRLHVRQAKGLSTIYDQPFLS